MLPNEELDVPDPERVVGGISSSLAVFAGPEEEEERNQGEVDDCNIYWGGSFGSGVQVLDGVDW